MSKSSDSRWRWCSKGNQIELIQPLLTQYTRRKSDSTARAQHARYLHAQRIPCGESLGTEVGAQTHSQTRTMMLVVSAVGSTPNVWRNLPPG